MSHYPLPFSPFENYTLLMAPSGTYAFFHSAVETFHCSIQHLSLETTNLVSNFLFQFIQFWVMRTWLKVAPQEKVINGQIQWSLGHGNAIEFWDDTVNEQFSHGCHWLPCSVRCHHLVETGFFTWKIAHCRCSERLHHLNIPIWRNRHCAPLFI